MNRIDAVSVILPSLNPTEKIFSVIQNVIGQGFGDIIVVNDGSRGEFIHIFDRIKDIEGCTVLTHEINKGKGTALKTGMAFFLENRPNGIGVVTIDDDGQHLPEDIRRCAEAMAETDAFVLGARDFSGDDVPKKSRIGNNMSGFIFRKAVGLKITDTQTGLRAIPRKYINPLLSVAGSRFEYETNMLLAAKRNHFDIKEITIETVYIDGNKRTHYRAFKDSFIIFFQFMKYAVGALLSCGIDLLLFYLLLTLLTANFPAENNGQRQIIIYLSTFIARVVSSLFNFFFNKNIVFSVKGKHNGMRMLKYYTLCAAVMIVSALLVEAASNISFINTPAEVTAMKMAVDTGLFVINYNILRKWVYNP